MTTLADKSLLSGGDNKPPMLEKHLYDSWKSRMELYMMNRPHGRMILASVEKGLTIPVFKHGDDPIDVINHVMSFLSDVVTSRYPTTNNQGRQISYAAGEGHMSKQCTKPRRKQDDSWFKDKVLLVQAQASGQILHEEELALCCRYKLKQRLIDLEQTLSDIQKEKDSLMQTVSLLKDDFKKEEFRNIDREIALEKRIKQLDNILEPKLYVGDIIEKTNPIVIPNSEETLMLAEESPIDHKFEMNSPELILSSRPIIVEVPKELPKVSMVNTRLNKLKHHLAGFDMVVKERINHTHSYHSDESWGKSFGKDDLRKLKGKDQVDNDVTKHPSDPEMIKIGVEPITLKLLNKQTAHSAYIKHTQEEAIVLRDLVEHVKSKYPLDQSLEFACRYANLVQELLTNISKTCPSVNNTDGKIVAVTLKNKDKRVRFIESVTSLGNTIIKTTSTSNLVSNKPMLSSTGVKSSTSASGSQPLGNIKKDKIWQTPSST
ncbi:hypothetical protein Tco_0393202 [Tanacetum coccineum]